jgi:hypothetical protein
MRVERVMTWPRGLTYALIFLLGAGCSGGSSDSEYKEALKAYEESAVNRTDEVAGTIAAAYVEQLASSPSVDDSFLNKFDGDITGLTDFLCDQIKGLRAKAGSGKRKDERLDDVRVSSEDLVKDGFARALLGRVVAAPAEQRDQLLDALGVKDTASDGAELRGTAALQSVGLLDGQNRVAIPELRTDQHVRYERWLHEDAAGFGGITSRLMGNARAEIDRCSSTA